MLQRTINEKGLKLEEVAKAIRIDLDKLIDILEGKTPNLIIAFRISDYLEIPLWEVVENGT